MIDKKELTLSQLLFIVDQKRYLSHRTLSSKDYKDSFQQDLNIHTHIALFDVLLIKQNYLLKISDITSATYLP